MHTHRYTHVRTVRCVRYTCYDHTLSGALCISMHWQSTQTGMPTCILPSVHPRTQSGQPAPSQGHSPSQHLWKKDRESLWAWVGKELGIECKGPSLVLYTQYEPYPSTRQCNLQYPLVHTSVNVLVLQAKRTGSTSCRRSGATLVRVETRCSNNIRTYWPFVHKF